MGRRSGKTHAVFLAAAVLSGVLAPAYAANAATVTSDGVALTYSAAPGEANRIFIVQGLDYHVFEFGATINAGAGCSAVSSQEPFAPSTKS
jgi:hypothetical protein